MLISTNHAEAGPHTHTHACTHTYTHACTCTHTPKTLSRLKLQPNISAHSSLVSKFIFLCRDCSPTHSCPHCAWQHSIRLTRHISTVQTDVAWKNKSSTWVSGEVWRGGVEGGGGRRSEKEGGGGAAEEWQGQGGRTRQGGGWGVGVRERRQGLETPGYGVRARLEPSQGQARGRSSPPRRTPDLQHKQQHWLWSPHAGLRRRNSPSRHCAFWTVKWILMLIMYSALSL